MAFKLEALEKHKDFTMWMSTEKTQGALVVCSNNVVTAQVTFTPLDSKPTRKMRKPLAEAQMKPEEEEPRSSSSSVKAPRVSPESPPSLKPVASSVLDRVLTCV